MGEGIYAFFFILFIICIGTSYSYVLFDIQQQQQIAFENSEYFDTLICKDQKEYLKTENVTHNLQLTYITNCIDIQESSNSMEEFH